MNHKLKLLINESFPNVAFISYVLDLRKCLDGCRTVIDIGCGPSSPLRFVDIRHSVGLDGFEPNLVEARKIGTHNEYVLSDVRELADKFGGRRFDCCLALDVLEHLSKPEGYKFLSDMEQLASERVVVFTPNGFMPQGELRGNELERHLSGWEASELQALGYRVSGVYGWKIFRGETHNLRFRPKVLWGLLSILTKYFFTRYHAECDAALLAVKVIGKKGKG